MNNHKLSLAHIAKYLCCVFLLTAFSTSSFAQSKCVINGTMDKDLLRYTKKEITKLYLNYLDEYDRLIPIDSTSVSNKSFKFEHTLKADDPVLMYFITGFDNGSIPVWVEPGEVKIHVRDAAFPTGSLATGTVTNELYNQYRSFERKATEEQNVVVNAMTKEHGEAYVDSEEGMNQRLQVGAAALLRCNAARIRFLIEHNDSPLAPLMLERELSYLYEKEFNEKLVASISPVLHNHPYYRSFSNTVKAIDISQGSDIPDITIPLVGGEVKHISDYQGKYVLLDFWASWCGPCLREMPKIKEVYEAGLAHQDKFVLISFSLDNKKQLWLDALKKHDMQKPGWVHGSDLFAWGSPAVKYLGIDAIPKTVLIDPEGKIISMSLRGDEMVKRVKQILSGDLYYDTQTPPKK
ncbi:MAG: thioredoxin-like domain-containing protein [Prevotella sp.]|jgi:thiol-disulfide isomerase/thioredoxin